MSVSSTGSTGLATPGIGSGLDVTGLVSKLMTVEQLPLTQIQRKQATDTAQLSAYGSLKSALSQLQTAAQALSTPAKFAVTSASVADSTVFSAASVTNAVPGSYDVAVTALAQAQKLQSAAIPTGDITAGSTLTIALGKYTTTSGTTTFAANSSSTTLSLTLTSSNNTLAGIQSAINSANMGVTASIVSGTDGDHLTLTSNSTGASNQIKLTSSIAGLNYDLSTGGATATMTQMQAAADAAIKVDGIAATSSSNVFTDAIKGVTLTVAKLSAETSDTDPTPVTTTLTVAKSTSAIQTAVQTLVTAYNAVDSQISSATAYNASTGQASTLTGDGTVRMIQTQLRSLFKSPVTGAASGTSVLSDIGISFQKDGTLALDNSKLSAALADPNRDVSKLFAKVTSVDSSTLVVTTKSTGYASQLDTLIGSMLGSSGALAARTDSINTAIANLTKKSEALTARLSLIQKNYMNQFNALDTMLSSMSATSSYLTTQLESIAALTNQSSK